MAAFTFFLNVQSILKITWPKQGFGLLSFQPVSPPVFTQQGPIICIFSPVWVGINLDSSCPFAFINNGISFPRWCKPAPLHLHAALSHCTAVMPRASVLCRKATETHIGGVRPPYSLQKDFQWLPVVSRTEIKMPYCGVRVCTRWSMSPSDLLSERPDPGLWPFSWSFSSTWAFEVAALLPDFFHDLIFPVIWALAWGHFPGPNGSPPSPLFYLYSRIHHYIIFLAVSRITTTRNSGFLILFTIVKQSFWEPCCGLSFWMRPNRAGNHEVACVWCYIII